ncbi:hypothetical protein [Burkholderia ubonensis]|uniref:Uncharacterized protein n=1 Tax=Burkholderia ubonensis TaxID=101571 RepID=A0ABD4E074_9BURK|nr:hypothetical protein [Burkholderia ubonensis]KVN83513.1 hypothetical protein WJ68_16515 [Burkholderia ubonensis]
MILTTYTIATPAGVFQANWDEDEEIPVSYTGDEEAIAFFRAHLELATPSGADGALVRFDALEPDDFDFFQADGITVLDPLPDPLDDQPNADDDTDTPDMQMQTIYDSASDADTFTLIGEGAQLLASLDENSDSFFADLGRLREIVLALGGAAPAVEPSHSEQYESYRRAIEEAQTAGTLASMPGLLEQIRVDARLNDGEAEELLALAADEESAPVIEPPAAVASTTSPLSDEIMQKYIAIAADSIEKLRRIDVYRVLDALPADNPDGMTRAMLATWIATKRPDLAKEVTDVMAEEWPGDAWAAPAAEPAVTVTDPLPEGVTVVPPIAPAENGNRAADLDFLKSVTAQTIDMMADGVAERIETTLGAYPGDTEIEATVREAVASYTDHMTKAIGA